jgi:hypothetical protein
VPTTWSSTSAEQRMGNWSHSTRHACGPPVVAGTVLAGTVVAGTVVAGTVAAVVP